MLGTGPRTLNRDRGAEGQAVSLELSRTDSWYMHSSGQGGSFTELVFPI